MSRLGKKPIKIKDKTEVTVKEDLILVKGPLGELQTKFDSRIEIKIEDNQVHIKPKKEDLEFLALWGTYSSLISNMIEGVNKEFQVKLEIEGIGFKASVTGNKMTLNIGFSHPVSIEIPKGVKVSVEKSEILVSGIDKNIVSQFAADIRDYKRPEPYKGKGIKYAGEVIRRKEGKKTV